MTALLLAFVFVSLHAQEIERKEASFYRSGGSANIKVDGHGSEAIWTKASSIQGFTQQSPETRSPSSMPTDIRVIYDNEAIYILAHCKEERKEDILAELSVRDELFGSNTDIFGIYIDAYQAGNAAMGFFVTPKNIQSEIFYTESREDRTWDVVWESATQITDQGWFAELKIPYRALRFPKKEDQKWNINFLRRIRRFRETAHWNFINPNIDGFINQFGSTTPLKDIDPPLRLTFTPYMAGVLQKAPGEDWEPNLRGGMDLKWGIDQSFTLDMTLVPDFSNVRTDNQVLNLSPFEIQFQENRPFFTEGIDLFDRDELFYSRRIGGRPIGFLNPILQAGGNPRERVLENPDVSQLINATKLSGRTQKGLGIGVINAVVGTSNGIIENTETGQRRRVKTQPLTNYNMVVFDQNLPHNSSIAFVNTNVWRAGDFYDANVSSLETRLRDRKQQYQFAGKAALSQKYYSDRADDFGYRYTLSFGKISGFWRYTGSYNEESRNYDTNDFGFLLAPNERTFRLNGGYYQNKPFGKFVRGNAVLGINYNRLHTPNVFSSINWTFNSFILSKNFWGYGVNANYQMGEARDYFEPRLGDFSRHLPIPSNYNFGAFLSSNYANPFALDIRGNVTQFNESGRWEYYLELEPRFRFSDRFSLFAGTSYNQLYGDQGWVGAESGSGINDPLIGTRDWLIINNEISTKYTFTNRINLNLRLRHNWSQVLYSRFEILNNKSELKDVDYPGNNGRPDLHDINFNTLNIDATFTWRFAPGSDLIIAWNGQLIQLDDRTMTNYFQQINTILNSEQQTTLSLRVLYFIDYNNIARSLRGTQS